MPYIQASFATGNTLAPDQTAWTYLYNQQQRIIFQVVFPH